MRPYGSLQGVKRAGLLVLVLSVSCSTEPSVPGGGSAAKDASASVLDSGVVNNPGDAGAMMMGCEAPRRQCGSRCINVLTHAEHCGDCNSPCTGGAFCSNGQCSRTCPQGLQSCGASCVDFGTDRDHCGMCDRACGTDRDCRGGDCLCPMGYIECRGNCIDPETSASHCGVCDRTCGADQFCSAGSCMCRGGERETDCNDGDDEDCDGKIDCADEDCVGAPRGCMGQCGMGTQTCEASGQWTMCEGGNGEAEICGDGIDQDCNGSDLRTKDAWEDNDVCADAAWITMTVDPMTSVTPSFDSIDDRADVFKFNVEDGFNFGFPENIEITLEDIPMGADYDVFLYRNEADCRARNPLGSSVNLSNDDELIDWQEVFNSDDSGTFYIRVVRYPSSFFDCSDTYTLTVNGLN